MLAIFGLGCKPVFLFFSFLQASEMKSWGQEVRTANIVNDVRWRLGQSCRKKEEEKHYGRDTSPGRD